MAVRCVRVEPVCFCRTGDQPSSCMCMSRVWQQRHQLRIVAPAPMRAHKRSVRQQPQPCWIGVWRPMVPTEGTPACALTWSSWTHRSIDIDFKYAATCLQLRPFTAVLATWEYSCSRPLLQSRQLVSPPQQQELHSPVRQQEAWRWAGSFDEIG